jgi:cytochrome c peroxidase
LRGCARLVVAFLRSLQFSRDGDGQHNGAPYDAFLAANLLPRAPRSGESPREYARRLGELIAALRVPRYIEDPARRLVSHDQAFRFGAEELRGMRIFFREGVGINQSSGAGNCVECHVPPHFTDFKFHNTGVAQDDFDSVHGGGEFAALEIPDLASRARDPNRWLPSTSAHPSARGVFSSVPSTHDPGATDLGLWNIYANPDFPASQPALARLFNPNGSRSADEVLISAIARFKTATVRDLGHSAPYLHTGRAATIEATVSLYQRMNATARDGKMRNAPPEFFAMRLDANDVGPLVAFLRALNEDYKPVHLQHQGPALSGEASAR